MGFDVEKDLLRDFGEMCASGFVEQALQEALGAVARIVEMVSLARFDFECSFSVFGVGY